MRRFLPLVSLNVLSILAILGCGASGPAPAPAARTTELRAATPPPPSECGPEISGLDRIADVPVVMLGELHGQSSPPVFAIDVACRLALRNKQATLALEIPRQEQARIDAYLASDGSDVARRTLLEGTFWTRPFQDGRSSTAMLDLLEKARRLRREGLGLTVAAVDDEDVGGQTPRERAMANGLVALARAKRGPVVMLVGNYHAHTRPGAPWDPAQRFMGAFVRDEVPAAIGLDVRYGKGEEWVCLSAEATECGALPTPGNDQGAAPWTVALFPSPDEGGLSGTFTVGPAVASEPARGLSEPMKVAKLVRQFRSANRPRMVDGIPADSAMSAEDRATWCGRLVPLARAHLALAGDSLATDERCAVTVVPAASRLLVPDVRVRFDVEFYFTKPYAAASYDRESRTLFLPAAAVVRPWDEVRATRHEWLHAKLHARARREDATAMALQTILRGPDFRPDGFYVDELPVNLCDALDALADDKGDPTTAIEQAAHYAKLLRKELDAMKKLPKKATQARAGVTGVTLAWSDSVERWVGGRDLARSLSVLEAVWRDADRALTKLRADPPDVASVRALPLFAGDACVLPDAKH